jgi:hypothetical protein
MFERVRERTQELRDYYSLPGGTALHVKTENGTKILLKVEEPRENFSNQGGLMWLVSHAKRGGRAALYGPMDTRELRMMNPELYWGAEINWAVHGIDIPEGV